MPRRGLKLAQIPDISFIGDSKSYLSGLFLKCIEKRVTFCTFLVGGRNIRYWLEMTSFWFVMILCITTYVGGWRRPFISAKKFPN